MEANEEMKDMNMSGNDQNEKKDNPEIIIPHTRGVFEALKSVPAMMPIYECIYESQIVFEVLPVRGVEMLRHLLARITVFILMTTGFEDVASKKLWDRVGMLKLRLGDLMPGHIYDCFESLILVGNRCVHDEFDAFSPEGTLSEDDARRMYPRLLNKVEKLSEWIVAFPEAWERTKTEHFGAVYYATKEEEPATVETPASEDERPRILGKVDLSQFERHRHGTSSNHERKNEEKEKPLENTEQSVWNWKKILLWTGIGAAAILTGACFCNNNGGK